MTGNDAERSAQSAWAVMSELVLDNERRREVSEAVGLPFARVRALCRVAAAPMTPGALAAALTIEPANCTPLIDDLEKRGLVERRPNPDDRRSKLVVATPAGARLGKRATGLLSRPPAALANLPSDDLRRLAEILARVQPRQP